MKKVVLVAYNLNPNWGSEGGRANKWLESISKYYMVDVYTDVIHRQDILNKNYHNCTFRYIEGISPWRRWSHIIGLPIGSFVFFKKVQNELKRYDLREVSIIHCLTPAGVYSYNSIFKIGRPVVIGPLGGGLPTPSGFGPAFRSEKIRTYLREGFYTIIKHIKGWKEYMSNAQIIILGVGMRKEWLPTEVQEKCVNIPDAVVDTEFFVPLVRTNTSEITRILFVGRLISNKGPLLLLEAVKRCMDWGTRNFVVEIAGSGALETEVKRIISEYQVVDNVNLLGKLPRKKLLEKYQGSDIFCLPTLREPGGNAILEAMSCGLPVITTDYGGPAVFINEECGIKISLKNYDTYVHDLAVAMRLLIDNPMLRKQMGNNARYRVKKEFSLAEMEKQAVELYATIALER